MKRRLTEEDGHVAHSPWGGVQHHAPSGKRRLNHGELGTLPSERRKPAAGDSPGRWRGAGTLGPQHAGRHTAVGSRRCGRAEHQCGSFRTDETCTCHVTQRPQALGVCPTEMKTVRPQKPACERLYLTVVGLKPAVPNSEQ